MRTYINQHQHARTHTHIRCTSAVALTHSSLISLSVSHVCIYSVHVCVCARTPGLFHFFTCNLSFEVARSFTGFQRALGEEQHADVFYFHTSADGTMVLWLRNLHTYIYDIGYRYTQLVLLLSTPFFFSSFFYSIFLTSSFSGTPSHLFLTFCIT